MGGLRRTIVLSQYSAALIAVVGWLFESPAAVYLGGIPCAAFAALGILGGALNPIAPLLFVVVGVVAFGGVEGGLVGNALSIVFFEARAVRLALSADAP
jgi:hypothetical protein